MSPIHDVKPPRNVCVNESVDQAAATGNRDNLTHRSVLECDGGCIH